MDIVEFFKQNAGKWLSQRTSHDLNSQQMEAGKSELQIEFLDHNDPDVTQLCQQYQIDPALSSGGWRVKWDGTLGQSEKKQTGATILVTIPDQEQANQGKMLQKTGEISRYSLSHDQVLTLITETDSMYTEECLWFASPNLRQRTSVIKDQNGFSIASFYSEIRMGVKK